jgi:hypothetical protein
MNIVLALLVVIAVAGIVWRARLPAHLAEAVRGARGTYSVVSDPSLTDDEKERRLKEEAPRLIGLLGRIVMGSALALGLPIVAVWAVDRLGLVSLPEVIGVLVRIDFLVAVSALGVLVVWWVRRRGG